MSIKKQYAALEEKLEKLLADNGLVGTFENDDYPITLTVGMDASPAGQMQLYDVDDNGASAIDANLRFVFSDGDILVRTHSRLVISDEIMSKIKGYAKKLHYLYLQDFFRYRKAQERKRFEAELPSEDYAILHENEHDEDEEEE